MGIDALSISEVSEADAKPPVKGVYDDIKATLRVPVVNLVFRVLATQPDYLQLVWQNLRPNVCTSFFESRADAIRAAAVERVSELGAAPAAPPDVADTLRVFHYVNPKLLIAVAAVRAATNGQYPKLGELPADEKRQIKTGIPSGAPALTLVDPTTAEPRVQTVLADIRTTLGLEQLNSDYRALAQWPDYVDAAWAGLKPHTQGGEYRRFERELRLMAEEAILDLPFRIDINPHVMRHIGMDERELDWARSTLDRFYRMLPGLILNIAYFAVGAFGGVDARQSPYPLELL